MQYLLEIMDASVIAGYEAQSRLLIEALSSQNRSTLEVVGSNTGGWAIASRRAFFRGNVTVS